MWAVVVLKARVDRCECVGAWKGEIGLGKKFCVNVSARCMIVEGSGVVVAPGPATERDGMTEQDMCEVDLAEALGVPRKVLRELRSNVLKDEDWYVGSNRSIVYRAEALGRVKKFVNGTGGFEEVLGSWEGAGDDSGDGGKAIVGDSGASEFVEVVLAVKQQRMERHGHVVKVHRVWAERPKMVEGLYDGKRVRVEVRDARLMRPGMVLGPCERMSAGVFVYRGQCPVKGKARRFYRVQGA